MAQDNSNLPAHVAYTPVEMIGIFRNYFERKKPNDIVWVRGIYIQLANQNPQWQFAYDELRDVNSPATLTLKINHNDRTKLRSNSLVQIGGLIEMNPFQNGNIQIVLAVTRVEIEKDEFVTEQDLKREEIRLNKNKRGFQNVDVILETKLFKDERPKVLLVFAGSSITAADFRAGLQAAASNIDFTEDNVSFGNAAMLSSYLKAADVRGFDAIALIRGGGAGIEALDAIDVLQTVATMSTAVISAIGHVQERLFFKTLADKEVPVPHALGSYFKDMVEGVAEKRNNSRAVLVKQVQAQFQKQIDDSNKKNKELLAQVAKMQKQSEEQSKAFNENLAKVQKENKENIDKLNKQNKENLDRMQAENKKTVDAINKSHQENFDKIQKTNGKLQKSLEKLNAQNTQSAKDLAEAKAKAEMLQKQLDEAKNKGCAAGCMGVIAALVTLAAACYGLVLILL